MSNSEVVFLPANHLLTVTAGASDSGHVVRISPGSESSDWHTISASSTNLIGPFDEPYQYRLYSDEGELSYSKEAAYNYDGGDNRVILSNKDNATSRRLKGKDFSGSSVQGYEGIFYHSSYDTWGALKTRLSYGSNTDMDMILQASNDLLFLCTNDGNGSEGKIKFMVNEDQAIEYHFSDDLTPNKIAEWDVNGLKMQSGKALYHSVAAGITASATQTQGQQALTSVVNQVSTVGTAGDVVTLPAAVAGLRVLVINDGANSMDIYPASGDDLGAGVDTALSLAASGRQWFTAYDATNWVQA